MIYHFLIFPLAGPLIESASGVPPIDLDWKEFSVALLGMLGMGGLRSLLKKPKALPETVRYDLLFVSVVSWRRLPLGVGRWIPCLDSDWRALRLTALRLEHVSSASLSRMATSGVGMTSRLRMHLFSCRVLLWASCEECITLLVLTCLFFYRKG